MTRPAASRRFAAARPGSGPAGRTSAMGLSTVRLALVLLAPLSVAMAPGPLRAQHGHPVASGVRLAVEDDPGAAALTVRLGPVSLPARSSHSEVAQPPDLFLPISFDGWLLAYHPWLVDVDGHAVAGRLLHHVAFWNTARSDFLCPNKEKHIFGAGGEMNDWMALPGVGYRVSSGDRIRVSTMFHNPMGYRHAGALRAGRRGGSPTPERLRCE